MKMRLILPAMLLTAVTAVAQVNDGGCCADGCKQKQVVENTKPTREQKRQMKEREDSLEYVRAVNALNASEFVMEADQLVFKRGESAFVTSMTNFISLSGDKAVVQIAPYNGGGPNGVGGITLEGRASSIKMSTDSKGNVSYSMMVMGSGISASVDIRLNNNSNRVSVTINPNFNSQRLTLYGRLLPTELSSVHKGSSF